MNLPSQDILPSFLLEAQHEDSTAISLLSPVDARPAGCRDKILLPWPDGGAMPTTGAGGAFAN